MIGYRPATRIVTALVVSYFVVISVQIMFEPASDIRVGGLALSSVAALIFRIGYRPTLRISWDNLIVDQPWVRWTIPGHAIKNVTATRGVISILTTTGEIQPWAFTSSLISNIINNDKYRRAAVKTINDWRSNNPGASPDHLKVWSLKQVVLDAAVFVGGWQIVYSILLLLGRASV